MRSITSCIAVALLSTALPHTVSGEESHVVTLTTSEFEGFLEKSPIALIEFYAPWCGHCKKLEPEFEKAAKELKEKNLGVTLAKVDAVQEKELAERFEVRGYPTIKLFRKGKPQEYDGGRTGSTIVEWIEKHTGPAVKTVTTKEELESMKSLKSVLFVLTVAKAEGGNVEKFEKVADANRELGSFVTFVDSDSKDGEVTVYRTDESPVTTSDMDEEKLLSWMKSEAFPLFGPINGDNYSQYVARTQDLAWVCMSNDDAKKYADALREVAGKTRDQLSFVHLNTEEFGSHAENALGVSTFPALVIQQKAGRYVYPHTEFDAEKMAAFAKDVADGKVEKAIKSEPIPETNDGPVKVVVAKNFEEMVFPEGKEGGKDVMLEVYAPWCGHCKSLEPIYKELAEKLQKAGNDHVVIAKMDGSANESPSEDFQWRGFPTIFWIKAGSKKPETYSGERDLKGLMQYIKDNASKPVTHDEL